MACYPAKLCNITLCTNVTGRPVPQLGARHSLGGNRRFPTCPRRASCRVSRAVCQAQEDVNQTSTPATLRGFSKRMRTVTRASNNGVAEAAPLGPYRVLITGSTKVCDYPFRSTGHRVARLFSTSEQVHASTHCGDNCLAGIGRALVETFLSEGDTVCVTSRSAEAVKATLGDLKGSHKDRVCGTPCDVSRPADVEALRAFAEAEMGGVDIWINNAGSNGYSYENLIDTTPEVLKVHSMTLSRKPTTRANDASLVPVCTFTRVASSHHAGLRPCCW
eukprot:9389313-Pyramimonas_sp.AAC.3